MAISQGQIGLCCNTGVSLPLPTSSQSVWSLLVRFPDGSGFAEPETNLKSASFPPVCLSVVLVLRQGAALALNYLSDE